MKQIMNDWSEITLPENKSNTFWPILITLLVLLVIGFYISLRYGAIVYRHSDIIAVLKQPFLSNPIQDVIIDLRLPRMLAAVVVGAALATAGLMMQGITRNPIADPSLLGVNAGAGLALAISYAIFGSVNYRWIILICLLGACIACILVFSLSYVPRKGYSQLRLILAGAMVAMLFFSIGQGVTLYFKLSGSIIGWQAGGLIGINWRMLTIISPVILIALTIAQLFAHQLTILSLDETVAKSLGQKTTLITLLLLTIVLMLSAAAVALVGSIAFVGLIIPHIIKQLAGKDYRTLLPLAMLAGAVFMLWVDWVCRIINPPYEAPLNAIISLVGLPCFLWLLNKGRAV